MGPFYRGNRVELLFLAAALNFPFLFKEEPSPICVFLNTFQFFLYVVM
jgi:hypothetical protein